MTEVVSAYTRKRFIYEIVCKNKKNPSSYFFFAKIKPSDENTYKAEVELNGIKKIDLTPFDKYENTSCFKAGSH